MRPAGDGFGRLAKIYPALERIAFGRALEMARFSFIDELLEARRILILGEGDGRFLAELLRRHPGARVDVVDASGRMLARASRRLTPAQRAQVTFHHADACAVTWPRETFDAVVTLFFLDCLPTDAAAALIARHSGALGPEGRWLWADFVIPATGWGRLRASAWVTTLYAFFRLSAGLRTYALPDVDAGRRAAGLIVTASRTVREGLIRAEVWKRPPRQ